MNAIPDKFAQWDAAYVLGALSPAERREFEEHLASCPPCQAAVSELAAMPGLLATGFAGRCRDAIDDSRQSGGARGNICLRRR